ncbi:SDR family oxidoreductase [soil metagenome]
MTRTIVITGASSGIGANAAGRLAAAGWDVAVVGRNPERTRSVAESVGGTPFLADYDRLDDVRALADALQNRYERIDVLANNAGGLIHERGLSADGHERTLQHNHLAPFLLTKILMPLLESSAARVISTASVANLAGQLRLDDLEWQKRPWIGGWRAYGTSKIATILFTQELAKRTRLDAFSFHPGYVATSFGAESGLVKFANFVSRGSLGISAEQGATPLVHLASQEVDVPNGTYFDGLKPFGRINRSARPEGIGAELWDATEKLVSSS